MTDLAIRAVPRVRDAAAAHVRSVELPISDVVAALQSQLGQALLRVIADRDTRTLTRWVNGTARPPQAAERLLRDTFQVVELLTSAESSEVTRAWFMGMNPQLEDESPAETLAAGRSRDVMAAARAFLNAG